MKLLSKSKIKNKVFFSLFIILGGLFIISSNDKYTLDSYASYQNNVRSAVKLYEEKGLWKVETDTVLPHLGDAKAAATTVRISK